MRSGSKYSSPARARSLPAGAALVIATLASFGATGCLAEAADVDEAEESLDQSRHQSRTVAVPIEPVRGADLDGFIRLTEIDGGVKAELVVRGAPRGVYSVHVHERARCGRRARGIGDFWMLPGEGRGYDDWDWRGRGRRDDFDRRFSAHDDPGERSHHYQQQDHDHHDEAEDQYELDATGDYHYESGADHRRHPEHGRYDGRYQPPGHIGDIYIGRNGRGTFARIIDGVNLRGRHPRSLIGRSIVVHEGRWTGRPVGCAEVLPWRGFRDGWGYRGDYGAR